jgi:hypothetical protein
MFEGANDMTTPALDHSVQRTAVPRHADLERVPRRSTRRSETNVLVIALDPVLPRALPNAEVLVVAPALNSWFRHWLSDDDAAIRRAEARAGAVLDRLERTGVHAEGRVGDADPLLAIADALTTFPADAIVIAAEPEHAGRLADDLVWRAQRRFGLPVVRAGARFPRAA